MLYSALTPPVCFFTNANKSIARLSALLVNVVSMVARRALRVSLVVRRLVPARLYLPLQHGHREHNTRSSLKYLRSLIRYTHTHLHLHIHIHHVLHTHAHTHTHAHIRTHTHKHMY